MVSIIIPIYNVEKYLDKCLSGISVQTYEDLQVICVVDGSPDCSIDICRKYAEKDPRFEILEQKNSGCAIARNNALKVVRGEYICFIDPDDYVNESYIELLYNAMQSSDADIGIATMIRVRGNSKKFRTFHRGMKKYDSISDIFSAANCPPEYAIINKMYKSRLIIDNCISFETGCLWCDDVRFCVDTLLAAKRIVTVEDAIYYYIKRKNSISHSQINRDRQLQRFRIRSSAVLKCISNGVVVSPREMIVTKMVYSIFGIPLLKLCVNMRNRREYALLLGLIPIFIRTKKR